MRICVPSLLLLVGCASAQARTDKPGEFLPLPLGPTALDAGDDPGGDADFRLIAHRASNPYDPGARSELEAFLANHPNHHQRPAAVAMLAGVLLMQGDAASAKNLLDGNASYLPSQEREFFGGLCASQLHDPARALDVLKPYLRADPPLRMGGLPDADVRRLLRTSLAESLVATGNAGEAIDQLELYAQIDGNRSSERAFALRRAEEIAAKTSDTGALEALVGRRGLFVRGVLGLKGGAALRARGDVANADRLEQEAMAVRRQLGLEPPLPSATPGDPLRLGLVVPLSGTQSRLGEVIARGAALVVAAATHAVQPTTFHLVMRDSVAPPDRSALGGGTAAGLLSLAREEKVIGVVSTPDARAGEMAGREGVPFILLDERTALGQPTSFSLIHPAEARAVALARQALELGARRFAILGPDNAAARRLAAAFRRTVEAGGGRLNANITYPPNTTSFASEVADLRKVAFEALFVPDEAGRLELIAPALAVADIWPRSPRLTFSSSRVTANSGPGRRESLLLSTAFGVSSKLLQHVGRYVQGAMFCPGFFPAGDTRSGSFVSHFMSVYGTPPTATDAYGYDGVFLLRGAVERGAKTRADVLRLLATQTFEGLTGNIRFGRDRNRIDPPLIYVVTGDTMLTMK